MCIGKHAVKRNSTIGSLKYSSNCRGDIDFYLTWIKYSNNNRRVEFVNFANWHTCAKIPRGIRGPRPQGRLYFLCVVTKSIFITVSSTTIQLISFEVFCYGIIWCVMYIKIYKWV